MGYWIAYDEQVFLGEIAAGGNFTCCLIILGIFMGFRGAYSLGQDFKVIICGASYKGMGLFYAGGVTLKTRCKYFNFATGAGMKCIKWLKNGAGKDFIFMKNILLVQLKNLYIQYAWISIMKKQNSNQNVRVEKIVVFVKTFDHYDHKFSFGNFFSCPVNYKRIWNWSLDQNLIMAIYTMMFEKLYTILR